MSSNLLHLSEKVDSTILELFDAIPAVSTSIGIPFFVVGATARDIIFFYGYGIETTRATADIDFAVQVENWDQYNKFIKGLIATGHFRQTPNQKQRLIYKKSQRIDVIPFGSISDPDHSLTWPPENDIEMSTSGFKESYEYSLTVRLRNDPALDIKFASLSGLALLKIISWNDKQSERRRDAEDLGFIMRNYLYAGNEDRLFDEAMDIYDELEEKGGFDFEKAGSRLLGRDIAAIAIPNTKRKVIKILDQETGEKARYGLVEAMINSTHEYSSDFEENLELLEELKTGIQEIDMNNPS